MDGNYLIIELLPNLGIFLEIIGFILVLRFLKNPVERHLEEWITIQKAFHPNNYEKRIVRDFNYWRNYENTDLDDDAHQWLVPRKFAEYWRIMRLITLLCIIVGLLFQLQ